MSVKSRFKRSNSSLDSSCARTIKSCQAITWAAEPSVAFTNSSRPRRLSVVQISTAMEFSLFDTWTLWSVVRSGFSISCARQEAHSDWCANRLLKGSPKCCNFAGHSPRKRDCTCDEVKPRFAKVRIRKDGFFGINCERVSFCTIGCWYGLCSGYPTVISNKSNSPRTFSNESTCNVGRSIEVRGIMCRRKRLRSGSWLRACAKVSMTALFGTLMRHGQSNTFKGDPANVCNNLVNTFPERLLDAFSGPMCNLFNMGIPPFMLLDTRAKVSKAASMSGSGKFPKYNAVTTLLTAHAWRQSWSASWILVSSRNMAI